MNHEAEIKAAEILVRRIAQCLNYAAKFEVCTVRGGLIEHRTNACDAAASASLFIHVCDGVGVDRNWGALDESEDYIALAIGCEYVAGTDALNVQIVGVESGAE